MADLPGETLTAAAAEVAALAHGPADVRVLAHRR